MKQIKSCRYCHSSFSTHKKSKIYCSSKCMGGDFRKKYSGSKSHFWKKRVKISCKICSNLFSITQSEHKNKKHNFCSVKCAAIDNGKKRIGINHFRWLGGMKKINCYLCHKIFYKNNAIILKSKYNLCSKKCTNKWLKSRKKENNPNWTSKKLSCKCCTKIFYRTPSRIKTCKNVFCSRKCTHAYYSGVKSPYWKGERAKKNYGVGRENWIKLRQEILKRDDCECQNCGYNEDINKIHIHHIEPYRIRKNNFHFNLISLCASCHKKLEERPHKIINLLIYKAKKHIYLSKILIRNFKEEVKQEEPQLNIEYL